MPHNRTRHIRVGRRKKIRSISPQELTHEEIDLKVRQFVKKGGKVIVADRAATGLY